MNTELTKRQHRALDRMALSDTKAHVVGWIDHRGSFMPVIESAQIMLAVDRRGAMTTPTKYWFTEHTVTSNLDLTHSRGTYEVARHGQN